MAHISQLVRVKPLNEVIARDRICRNVQKNDFKNLNSPCDMESVTESLSEILITSKCFINVPRC